MIRHGDCMDLMKELEDDSIDACITDPPYGIGYQSARRIDTSEWKPKIENDEEPYTEWIKPLYEKMAGGGRLICFYRWDVQDAFLDEIQSAGFMVKSQIVWDKGVHGMGDLTGEFAPQHELMLYATKGRYEFKGTRPKTIYRSQRIDPNKLVHPNQKPLPLLRAIIKDITEPGELILDPFGGSFTTYVAAIREKRRAISYEKSDVYFKQGEQFIKDNIGVQELF